MSSKGILYDYPTLDENDTLDAARYRWIREQYWDSSELCVVTNPKITVRLGTDCPSGRLLDQAIDAAIREENDGTS